MSAFALWARSSLRRHLPTTIGLAVLAGLVAGLVGASFQAARRADGAIERHSDRIRSFDLIVFACPAGVDPNPATNPDAFQTCTAQQNVDRLTADLRTQVPGVQAAATFGNLVVGALDPSSSNGWGRTTLLFTVGPGGEDFLSNQILVAGRFPDPDATDELLIGEQAAQAGDYHVGDSIRVASWRPDNLDEAADGRLAPETDPITSRIVGIARFPVDIQDGEEDESVERLPDALYAGPGWTMAHAAGLTGYGFGSGVRLEGGLADADAFAENVALAQGWNLLAADPFNGDLDRTAIQRVLDIEQQAVVVFALIGTVAGLAFVAVTMARQLRLELTDRATLLALGFTRRSLIAGTMMRSLLVGGLAIIVASVTILLLSPLGPVGVANRFEFARRIRIDGTVLIVASAAVLLAFAVVAAVTVAMMDGRDRPTVRPGYARSLTGLGPVPRTALSFTTGNSPRVSVTVGAVAVAVAIAAGFLVASLERVVAQPVRYGAWWDVVVGDYSRAESLEDGVARLRDNSAVIQAAAIIEDATTIALDGVSTSYVAFLPVVGAPDPVMAAGRPPVAADEVALGEVTARELGKGIGDTLTMTWATAPTDGDGSESVDMSQVVTLTGVTVLNNPIRPGTSAGEGALVHADLVPRIAAGFVPQAIAVRLDPSVDRATAWESIRSDFPGSIRAANPPADLKNLDRIRFVPWLIAAMVGLLALASLIHALVTLLQRHSRDLAVLAALGFTPRQRRRVGLGVSVVLATGSMVLGVPAGIVVGRWLWRAVAQPMSIPSEPAMAWAPVALAPLAALIASLAVGALAARWVTRRSPAVQLRTE